MKNILGPGTKLAENSECFYLNSFKVWLFGQTSEWHRGSILASHPAAPGLNPASANIFFSLLLSLWTVL